MAVVPRLDVLVIGPGLGRDKSVRETLRQLLPQLRSAQMPLILDGDALYFISSEPDLIKGYTHLILTPNAASRPLTMHTIGSDGSCRWNMLDCVQHFILSKKPIQKKRVKSILRFYPNGKSPTISRAEMRMNTAVDWEIQL